MDSAAAPLHLHTQRPVVSGLQGPSSSKRFLSRPLWKGWAGLTFPLSISHSPADHCQGVNPWGGPGCVSELPSLKFSWPGLECPTLKA